MFLNADALLVYLTMLKHSTMKANVMALQETNYVITNTGKKLINRAKK
jgi:predicted transcriptional regulator